MSTQELIQSASRTFQVPRRAIGVAGLKDKFALTRQVISIANLSAQEAYALERDARIKILWVAKHRHKLRVGQHHGNNFHVKIHGPAANSLERAQAVVNELMIRGLPNYFGKQRFSNKANLLLGKKLLEGKTRPKYRSEKNRFAVEVYQSFLFNRYLAERIRREKFDSLFRGDVAVRHASGDVFIVEDEVKERPRFASFEISAAGPIFGYDMLTCGPTLQESFPFQLEKEILASEGLGFDTLKDGKLKRAKIYGSRRSIRVPISTIDLQLSEQVLSLKFFLPKGSYATVLLREIMKTGYFH